jgi:copper(I)-binding protein
MRSFLIAILSVLATTSFSVPTAFAHGVEIGPLKIQHPWTRATPKGATVAGGYMVVKNSGQVEDRLIAATVDGVTKTEIHEMKMNNGIMTMRPLNNGLIIPAGETVALKPGGFHLMMLGLQAPFLQGAYIKGRLTFEKAGTVEVEFAVEEPGANLDDHNMHHAQ